MKNMDKFYRLLNECVKPEKAFQVRGWDIENFHPSHVYPMLDKAAKCNANTIGLSHEICMNVEEIIYDWHRYQQLEAFSQYAHGLGMKVYLWTHEVNGAIDKWIIPSDKKKGLLNMESDSLFDFIAEKYRRAFERVPSADGFILSLTESQYQVQRDYEVQSKLNKAERMAAVINAVHKGCSDCGKLLIVRDFLRSPEEMDSFLEALKLVPEDVWVYTKCVPNDWEFKYPPHPLLGKVSPRKQIMELDLATEVGGVGDMPMCIVDYTKTQLLLAREKGLLGAIARCDDGFNTNLGKANEINVWSYAQLLNNPDVDTNILWKEWCKARYGDGAEAAEYVLRKSFDIVTKISYTLGFWTGSRAPSIEYSDGHLINNSNALWDNSPDIKEIEQGLLYPNQSWIQKVENEKIEAKMLAEECINRLDRYGSSLKAQDYKDLRESFERCVERAENDRLWAKTYFTFRLYRNTKDASALKILNEHLVECCNFIETSPQRKWSKTKKMRQFVNQIRGDIQKMQ